MTAPVLSTKSDSDVIVALDEATGSLACARHLRMPSQAYEGAEWALQALDDLPEDIRDRFAECIEFARATASAIVAESLSAPPWSREQHRRCEERWEELASVLDAICDAIRPATAQLMPPASPRKPRRPSLATQIRRAEKSGREVTSVTLPDGTKLNFGEGEPTTNTDLDNWLAKHARATERH